MAYPPLRYHGWGAPIDLRFCCTVCCAQRWRRCISRSTERRSGANDTTRQARQGFGKGRTISHCDARSRVSCLRPGKPSIPPQRPVYGKLDPIDNNVIITGAWVVRVNNFVSSVVFDWSVSYQRVELVREGEGPRSLATNGFCFTFSNCRYWALIISCRARRLFISYD
jgi:hypothetical protein